MVCRPDRNAGSGRDCPGLPFNHVDADVVGRRHGRSGFLFDLPRTRRRQRPKGGTPCPPCGRDRSRFRADLYRGDDLGKDGSTVFCGGKGEALSQAADYSRVIFGGAALIWLCNTFASILRGTGNMLVPAMILSVTASVQIVLCGSLVLGWGPFPKMGIVGAGISYICAFGITATLFFAFWLLTGRSGLRIDWRGSEPSGRPRDRRGEAHGRARRTIADLTRLEHIRGLVSLKERTALSARLLLFSANGFERNLIDSAKGRDDVQLIDLERIYAGS